MHGVVAERERVGLATATVERLTQAGDDGSEISDHGIQRIIAAPLDRLWKVGFITRREFEAGDKLRSDAYLASVNSGAHSVDWSQIGGAGMSGRVPAVLTQQRLVDASTRFDKARRAIRGRTWTVLMAALIHENSFKEIGHSVFGLRDPREATVAGRASVCVALSSAADHYGL